MAFGLDCWIIRLGFLRFIGIGLLFGYWFFSFDNIKVQQDVTVKNSNDVNSMICLLNPYFG
jgi:hypothetical protein